MTDRKHFIVLGAGVSGLSAAWRLAQLGASVDVLEARDIVGGLARTQRTDGYCLDVGPHSFFSQNDDVVRIVLALFPRPLQPGPRTVKFLYRNRYLDYPLTPVGVLTGMGPVAGMKAGLSFLRQKIARMGTSAATAQMREYDESVRDWAVASFGDYMYESFFKPYTEQFWKLSCEDLSSRTIPSHTKMGFVQTLRILARPGIVKKDPSLIEREALPTYYPNTGFGEIPELMAKAVTELGGRVHLNCLVTGVAYGGDAGTPVFAGSSAPARQSRPTDPASVECDFVGRPCAVGDPGRQSRSASAVTVSFTRNGSTEQMSADHVISTLPLNSFVPMLTPAPPAHVLEAASRLEYRALAVLGIATAKKHILGCGYMYLMNRPYNRISETIEFSAGTVPSGQNMLVVEIPCLAGSKEWNADAEALFGMCEKSLADDGFIKKSEVARLLLLRDEAAYPVYRVGYERLLNNTLEYLSGIPAISSIGRCGAFFYMDVDECIMRSISHADALYDRVKK